MAPVYDFRHVELDKIGRGKRIVKPPGGECSDIFGPENGQVVTPRKIHNYMQSNIFSPDSPDGSYQNGHSTPTTPPAKLLDTQNRLFGSSDEDTPRRVVNRQRSSIFEDEVADTMPLALKSTPGRRPQINPITGTPVEGIDINGGFHNGRISNGSLNGGTPNGYNGHSNGYCNGHSSPESPMSGTPRVRNPPGGKSSGIF